jgi:mono/diheme cytochrome c family protein
MKILKHTYHSTAVVLAAVALTACVNEEQSPGYEYMPDMYRSPAIEAYVDAGMDPFHYGDSLAKAQRNTQSARKPVAGTVPFSEDPNKVLFNMPYHLPNNDSGYAAAAELKSPLVETEAVIEEGKVIYEKFCVQCHGKKGQGDGAVVAVGGHPPPGAYDGALKDLPEGKMFHTITYGKGVMGAHKSLLNKEERWKVISYVNQLQGTPPNTAEGAGAPAETDMDAAGQTADAANMESENQ